MPTGFDVRGNPLGALLRAPGIGPLRGTMDYRDPGLVVAHETVFQGMPTQSFSNGVAVNLNGISWTPTIANSATMSITANGLNVTYPTSGEAFLVSPLGLPNQWFGKGILRRKPWAMWVHLHSWTLTNGATALAYVLGMGNNNYPEWSWGIFRARNVLGAPNNANGSFTAWGRFNGAEINSAFSASADTDGAGTTVQNTADDVCCVVFRTPYIADFYYGAWSTTGWPLFNDLKWGASVILPPHLSSAYVDYRDPATAWRLYLVSGSGGNNTSNNMTVARWRATYWID